MNIEDLVTQQDETAVALQKLIANCKKAPYERRTLEFIDAKVKELDELWAQFNKVDNIIRSLHGSKDDHPYFTKDMHAAISVRYREFRDEMELYRSNYARPSQAKGQLRTPQAASRNADGQLTNNMEHSIERRKLLRNQRALIQALTQNLNEVMGQRETDHPPSYYTIKAAVIEKHMMDLAKNNTALWESTDEDVIEEYTPQAYYELEAKAEEVLIQLHQHISVEQSLHSQRVPQTDIDVPLPRITLPKFNGNYMQWVTFKDLYTELIHKVDMSDAKKMHYLTTSLESEPRNLIKHLPSTGSNYTHAWSIITSRYDNKRLLVTTLLNKLMSQSSLKKESSSALKALHDITKECIHGLKAQGIPVQHWDVILSHILLQKMDQDSQTAFEQSLDDNKRLLTIDEIFKFLERRFQSFEARGRGESSSTRTSATATIPSSNEERCVICKQKDHKIYACKTFLNANIHQRWNWVKTHNLCTNCFKADHRALECKSRNCTRCAKKHNTLLHVEQSGHSSLTPSHAPQTKSNQQATTLATTKESKNNGYVLLSTAVIKLIASNGQAIECKAILDSGSQVNLITERVAKQLGLQLKPAAMLIEGIGNGKREARTRVNVKLQSRISKYSTRLEAFVLSRIIPEHPTQRLDTSNWPIPNNIGLADPHFNFPAKIDVLIGAEFYHDLLVDGRISLTKGLPTLQNTVFGWILAGKVSDSKSLFATCGICTEDDNDLTRKVERFWQLEETPTDHKVLTTAEKLCESHFALNTIRNSQGRFVVKLPFADSPFLLGESKQIAVNRFYALERRLAKDPNLKIQYTEFMDEYESLGHMTRIDKASILQSCYFIPHHCVVRPESSTTKLRVVFDASSKTSTGLALNDLMYTGPTIQSELFTLLLRFRCPRFVFTSDIQKMYRQILVHPEDRKYQLIVWRKDATKVLQYYQLNTVTYGTRSAPYLSTKCLQQLGKENSSQYPLGSDALLNDFYVDDCLTGSDSLATALETQEQLTKILQQGGLRLRKWCANHPKLLQSVPAEDQEVNLDFDDDINSAVKTLGLTWLPKTDKFCVKVNIVPATRITKRTVVSDVAKIFDPLGLLSPVVVTAKILIQQLWQTNLKWDDELTPELRLKWTRFCEELKQVANTHLPRHIFQQGTRSSSQIHSFADASEKAYGAAVYVRSIDKNGTIIVRLLCSKSRVAPLKTQTIPRLELCAALLSAQLVTRVKQDLKLADAPVYFWTDSEIVLSWINSSSSTLKTFVANRTARIQELSSPAQWRHVTSKQNPADVLSRGLFPSELPSCNLWLYGPIFLHGKVEGWPKKYSNKPESDNNLERRQVAVSAAATVENKPDDIIYNINNKNSFKVLTRIVAYMIRFKRHAKQSVQERETEIFLTPIELKRALSVIVRAMQWSDFKEEVTLIKKNFQLNKNSQLSSLHPFLDDEGVLRVRGRLEASNISYDAKHPMIIPYNNPLTKLLIKWFHEEHFHCGVKTLVEQLQQQFWIIKSKSMARTIVHNCIRCTKIRPRLCQQIMGDLPAARVQPTRPFMNSGVDFCGPFWTHFKIRGKRPQKTYVAVFCCFATKAIHLEIVSDLTTDAFVGCLKRFIGRRGRCQNIYCDNATNFVGANNQLSALKEVIHTQKAQEAITRNCSNKGIKFNFIPPRAPHFGGLWEAAVKSAKTLFVKGVANASLTYEELETVMVEIEAILNSRPLTPVSTNPEDITALTPGHFLIGEPLTSSVDSYATQNNISLLTRWKLVSHLKHEFWRRWSREYLHELQHRNKWKEQSENVKPGMMVIIQEDNLPPLQWALGRIVKTYTGHDNAVRVADIRTATGILKRPIHRLAPLPIQTPDQEEHRSDSRQINSEVRHTEITNTQKKIKHSNPNDGPQQPKRTRVSTSSALMTVLLTCLFLPSAIPSPIEVHPFASDPGIYFEKLGSAGIITSEWNLVTYINMQTYWKELDIMKNYPSVLKKYCTAIQTSKHCPIIVMLLKRLMDEIIQKNQLLKIHDTSRSRRGAFNVVGNVAHSLFGILDSQYAEEAANTIEKIRQNEDHLEGLFQNQTSFLDSTINIMKKNQQDIEGEFLKVEKLMTNLNNRFDNVQQELGNQSISQLVLELALQTTVEILYVQRIQDSLLDILTDTHHGKLSPELLSPVQLQRELINIKANLPSHLKLPTEELIQLYNLMSIEGRVTTNYVIFKLKLPLISTEDFELLHLIPVPWQLNNSFVKIHSPFPYLIVNLHRDQYFPLKEADLRICTSTERDHYLWQQNHPLYKKGSAIAVCELNLLNHITTNTSCSIEHTEAGPHWLQLHNLNSWIYSVKDKVVVNAVCDAILTPVTIQRSGLLSMNENCIIKQPLITIQGHKTLKSTSLKSYIPNVLTADLSFPSKPTTTVNNISLHYIPQITQLSAIQHELSSLRVDLPNKIRPHDIHHYTISYSCVIFIICILSWVAWKRCQKSRSIGISAPQPAPRIHVNTPDTSLQDGTEFITVY